ncbi:MAG: fibronectin type III domain-containing protein [Gemmatimonadota bacterium]|nr:fibronectin type III domain-containing protein [Gemmatimonadota bacterium]
MLGILVCLLLISSGEANNSAICWDLNDDRKVDFADFILFSQDFGTEYDFNDFIEFAKRFGQPWSGECEKERNHPSPRNTQIDSVSPSNVRLIWEIPDRPAVAGRILTQYIITHSPHPVPKALKAKINEFTMYFDVSRNSTSFKIEPLLAGIEYIIEINAVYQGAGLPFYSSAKADTVVTPEFKTPGPPIIVHLGWEEGTKAVITWSRRPRIKEWTILVDGAENIPWNGIPMNSGKVVLVGSLTDPYRKYKIVGKTKDWSGNEYESKPLIVCLYCHHYE